MKKTSLFLLASIFLTSSIIIFQSSKDATALSSYQKELLWPDWVHSHWVWENSGNRESALQQVDDYLSKGIPVGAVIIDRPWQTEPNSFITDPVRYGDLGTLVEEFHSRGVRVLMWSTSIINKGAENFQEAQQSGYLYKGKDNLKWWGGRGGLLDYHNDQAVEWWHGQMDKILQYNIDGWKVDATDPSVILANPLGNIFAWSAYKDKEYRDYFNYTRSQLGNDRVIMARPVDDPTGIGLPIWFAPVDVSYAAWVGDQDGTWKGLKNAMSSILESARLGYSIVGSDIGGFRSKQGDMRDPELFIRWTQYGAFVPLMENGGGGEHRPWKYGEEILAIYKHYAKLHTELMPYFYGAVAKAINKGKSLIKRRGLWNYYIGDEFYVVPFTEAGSTLKIRLPHGDWFEFGNNQPIEGGKSFEKDFSLSEFPVYIKKGAVISLKGGNSFFGLPEGTLNGFQSFALYPFDGGAGDAPFYKGQKLAGNISYISEADGIAVVTKGISGNVFIRVTLEKDGDVPSIGLPKISGSKTFERADTVFELLKSAGDGFVISENIIYLKFKANPKGERLLIN